MSGSAIGFGRRWDRDPPGAGRRAHRAGPLGHAGHLHRGTGVDRPHPHETRIASTDPSRPPTKENRVPELVTRDDRDGIATITLQRPETLNALSPALFEQFRAMLDEPTSHPESVGAVVLRKGRPIVLGKERSDREIQAGERPSPRPKPKPSNLRPAAADHRLRPRPLLHGRTRIGAGVRLHRRRRTSEARRHPWARAMDSHVDSANGCPTEPIPGRRRSCSRDGSSRAPRRRPSAWPTTCVADDQLDATVRQIALSITENLVHQSRRQDVGHGQPAPDL